MVMIHRPATNPMPDFNPEDYYDTFTHRPNQTPGGMSFRGRVSGGRGSIEQSNPSSNNLNDDQILKTRGPWYHTGNYIPAADPIRWTDSGPIRPEMHMRTITYRREAGIFGFAQEGLHTMQPQPPASARQQMQGVRQNRLTFQPFRGQSFSQTTMVQR